MLTQEQIAALAGLVKPLEWVWVCEYGRVACAKTEIGTYSLHADEDSAASRMLLFLHLTDDGDCTKYAIEVAAEYLDVDEMKARAQDDYQARILSALNLPQIAQLSEDASRAAGLALEVERLREALTSIEIIAEDHTLMDTITDPHGAHTMLFNIKERARAALDGKP